MSMLKAFFIILLLLTPNLYAYTSPIKTDEVVIFFPTNAYLEDQRWKIPIHGWIYEPQWDINLSKYSLNHFGEHFNNGPIPPLFRERIQAFFVDNERGKQIAILLGNQYYLLDKSTANGHFFGSFYLSLTEVAKLRDSSSHFITFEAVTRPDDQRHFQGKIQLIDKKGISIISDIDDTIKITDVQHKTQLLVNTFQRPFRPVPVMNTIYQAWSQDEDVTFHYISASPWQLYTPLVQFLSDYDFPLGSFHLRLFRWKDKTLVKFFQSAQSHKIETIETIMAYCPQRYFILVGDSGEHDPEIYATIARQHPQQVIKIVIRDVTGESAQSARYQSTFQDLPTSLWVIFREAATLPTELSHFLPQ